jgi:hypothetical protein
MTEFSNDARYTDPLRTPGLSEKSPSLHFPHTATGIPEGDPKCCLMCGQKLRLRRKNAPEGFAYCATCKALLPVEQFHADATKASGHVSACISCKRIVNAANRDKAKPDRKRYRKKEQEPLPVPTDNDAPYVWAPDKVDQQRAEVLAEYRRKRDEALANEQGE